MARIWRQVSRGPWNRRLEESHKIDCLRRTLQVVYAPKLSVLQQYGAAPLPQELVWLTVVWAGGGGFACLGSGGGDGDP